MKKTLFIFHSNGDNVSYSIKVIYQFYQVLLKLYFSKFLLVNIYPNVQFQ